MTFRYRRLPNVGRIKSRATDVRSEQERIKRDREGIPDTHPIP